MPGSSGLGSRLRHRGRVPPSSVSDPAADPRACGSARSARLALGVRHGAPCYPDLNDLPIAGRIHKTLRVTPAMAAGVTSELRDVEWIAELVATRDPKPGPRGPYRKTKQP